MVTVAPYGSWPSAVTPQLLVEKAVGLSATGLIGGRPAWVESRPSEAGRSVLVVSSPAGDPLDVLPSGFSVRSSVHEYGGRSWAPWGEGAVFTNWEDQRIYAVTPTAGGWGVPVPVTPEPPGPRAVRYADIDVSPDGTWLVAVRETHRAAAGAGETAVVDNDLVAVRLDGPLPATPEVLAEGHDFIAGGRISPDGSRLAWLTWDHPDMPWDHTELWTAPLDGSRLAGEARRVAGDPGESVSQPRWSPDGVLHYVSDRTGWWNLYDETARALAPLDAEFTRPDWVVGQASYAFVSGGGIVAAWSAPGGDRLGVVAGGTARDWGLEVSYVDSVMATSDGVLVIVGSPTAAPAVVHIASPAGDVSRMTVLRRSRDARLAPDAVSVPQPVDFPTTGGRRAHAYWYPPTNPDVTGPDGEAPPLVVMSHGGPTAAALPVLNYGVQFWTSRGFGVVDVDYGGSTGYGREYRNQLRGNWGVIDVDDCVAAARWLAAEGRVDPQRMVIRGGSAGGYTTLAALTFRDAFAGGASLYGVADLELLATDTHKFESRYLDGLVGPYPEARDLYRARSPIHHLDGLDRPIILFQGLEDAVVPPAQAQLMADALVARGIPVAHLTFAGEQHGFRQAATIVAVALDELAFYGRILGFAPADEVPALPIVNESALPPAAGA